MFDLRARRFLLALLTALAFAVGCGTTEGEVSNEGVSQAAVLAVGPWCTEDCSGHSCPAGYDAVNISGGVCRIDADDGDCSGKYTCRCQKSGGGRYTGKAIKYSCDTGKPVKKRGTSASDGVGDEL